MCAIRCSENFFKRLILSALRKQQYIRKYIKEDLIKVLFNLFNQKPLYYAFIYLKMYQVCVVDFSYTATLLERI